MIKECKQNADEDVLEESKGCRQLTKETWWWNSEVQATNRLKRVFFFFPNVMEPHQGRALWTPPARQTKEKAIKTYLDVETMLLMKIIKQQREDKKRLSKRLNIRLMINYIAVDKGGKT